MPKKVRFEEQERPGLCSTRSKLKPSPLPRLDSNQWQEIQKQYRFLMSTLRVAYSSNCQNEDTKIIRILRSAREICVTEIVSVLQESGVPSSSILELIQEPSSPLATQSDAAPSHPAKQTDPTPPSPPAKAIDPVPTSPPAKQTDPAPPYQQGDSTPLSPNKQRDPVPSYRQSGPSSLSPRQNNAAPPGPTQQSTATGSAHFPDNYPSREVQIYHRLCSGSGTLLRFPLSSNPFDLLLSREPLRPATKPRMAHVTLVYPPLEAWPVVASNGAYVTVEDVLFVIHKRRDMLPPNTLFNGLRPAYGGEYFLVLLSDG